MKINPLVPLGLTFTGAAIAPTLVSGWSVWPVNVLLAWLGLDLLWGSARTAYLRRRS